MSHEDSPVATAAEPQEVATTSDQQQSNQRAARRMPEDVRKHLIRLRDGRYYLPVAARVLWFRDEHPDWSLRTEIVEGGYEAGWVTVKATVLSSDDRIIATGFKTESRQDFPGGWVEKAETGAIGRALAMAGFGTQFAPEFEETPPEAARRADSTTKSRPRPAATGTSPRVSAIWPGPGKCPTCHAPAGKPHATSCPTANQAT